MKPLLFNEMHAGRPAGLRASREIRRLQEQQSGPPGRTSMPPNTTGSFCSGKI